MVTATTAGVAGKLARREGDIKGEDEGYQSPEKPRTQPPPVYTRRFRSSQPQNPPFEFIAVVTEHFLSPFVSWSP